MKRFAAILGLFAALSLGGCGGGLYIGWGDYGDDIAPSVSIADGQTSVAAGGVLRVAAAASDESGIDSVAFYRLDGDVATRLGSDGGEPYQWDVAVPADGRTTVSVFARARDAWGNEADSALLTVPVTP
ncbi:MAG: hypothetical protein IPP50_04245 [Piscinibacter sp.]|nr:hypothetical protein [Piscinibacter sp.]